jgi:hypothetical protein
MINFFKALAGSIVTLYLVCAGFLVLSVNAEHQADSAAAASIVSVVPSAGGDTAIKAEPSDDSNIVGDALDAQPKWMQLAANLIALAAAIAAVVPNTSPRTNVILKGLRWLLDMGAFNIFNAKNEKPKDKSSNYL